MTARRAPQKDQTSKGRSFRLHRADPRFPPSAPQGRPTLDHCLLGSARYGGGM
ncbi:hypothetical protein B0H19DRAFT_1163414 [Mycena capillaripes]|nr:hypothetical protein B0H19DRAFT_1163414 [Mycena capillaripes]